MEQDKIKNVEMTMESGEATILSGDEFKKFYVSRNEFEQKVTQNENLVKALNKLLTEYDTLLQKYILDNK